MKMDAASDKTGESYIKWVAASIFINLGKPTATRYKLNVVVW